MSRACTTAYLNWLTVATLKPAILIVCSPFGCSIVCFKVDLSVKTDSKNGGLTIMTVIVFINVLWAPIVLSPVASSRIKNT